MAGETEPAKTLLPYLQRADELQKHEPLVAYYCRLYAMEKGLKIPVKERTKTTNSILVSLMNQLEKDKKSLKLGPEDSLYVEGFASNVFAKADKQDRAGRADLNTAKTFYAASIFFEILYQFGELQPDIEQKQKYAVWKAADIRKALKEGRKPEPGPPGGDKDLSIPSTASTITFDVGQTESFLGQQPAVDVSHHVDKVDLQHPENLPTSPSSYPGPGFSSSDIHQPPGSHRTESPTYPEHYHDQPYSPEQQHTHQSYPSEGHSAPSYPSQDKPAKSYSFSGHPPNYPSYDSSAPHAYPSYDSSLENYPSQENAPRHYPSHENAPQHYPSHEASGGGYTYSNFQTYPSFNDSTLPAAPSHHPSYYHGSDATQPHQPAPASSYPSSVQHDSSRRNGTHAAAPSPPAAASSNYTYDSSYQPPVEKIAEAHKAARFAVGALAFDDVPVAVDFLRRSLELLTNPTAESH